MQPRFSLRRVAIPSLALAAFAFAADLSAQESSDEEITLDLIGQVVDSVTGRAVPGAAVTVSETGRYDITDEEGRFALEVPGGTVTLMVEQIGYAHLDQSVPATAASGPLLLELTPRPMVLEGLQVMTDRLARRRLATAMSVQTFRAEELRHSGGNLYKALRYGRGMIVSRCPRDSDVFDGCVYRRGRVVKSRLYIDDVPADGGLYELSVYSPAEIYAVEVYAGGQVVRVYTRFYMDRLAHFPRPLLRGGA